MEGLAFGERLGDLEERVTLLAQALEELVPILVSINGDLIRNGAVSQRDGLTHQDGIGAIARLAADACVQATPRPIRAAVVAAENGSLT